MSIVVLRGSSLELKLGWFFWLSLHSNHLQMTRYYPHSKEGKRTYSKSAHKSWNHYFVNFSEALQFEAVVPRLHTFHMDLHPPTHLQLDIPMVDV